MLARHKTSTNRRANARSGDSRNKGRVEIMERPSKCSLLRRLGQEGISVDHAVEIMKEAGIKVARATVQQQIAHGRNGHLYTADISDEALAELIISAPDPRLERWKRIARPRKQGTTKALAA